MKEINILYATDTNYAPHAAASIYSLLSNNKDEFEKINIYLIDDSISDKCKDKFNSMVSSFENAQIIFYPFEKLQAKLKLNDKTGYAQIGYARLMLSEMINADKVLYIDCDTIINGSLKELWETDMEENIIAGVQDNPAVYALEAVGMTCRDRYINGGVLLINLNAWRKENIEDAILKMIDEHNGFVLHHDQGIVNGVCRGKIKILHPKFNTMSQFFLMTAKQIKGLYDIDCYYTQKELDEATKKPIIIHFISKFYNRPWIKECSHPHKNLYIDYLSETPFDVVLSEGTQKRTVKIRRFIFNHFPFFVYAFTERVFNIKRKINAKRR